MRYVIICGGYATDTFDLGPIGQYLKSYDPEAFGGRGHAEWTERLDEAMRFDGFAEATALWKAVPSNHPVRASDGKPNRPLTAFTIMIEPDDGRQPVRRLLGP